MSVIRVILKTCLQRARGYLVHLLHGDDAVRHVFGGVDRPLQDGSTIRRESPIAPSQVFSHVIFALTPLQYGRALHL